MKKKQLPFCWSYKLEQNEAKMLMLKVKPKWWYKAYLLIKLVYKPNHNVASMK